MSTSAHLFLYRKLHIETVWWWTKLKGISMQMDIGSGICSGGRQTLTAQLGDL